MDDIQLCVLCISMSLWWVSNVSAYDWPIGSGKDEMGGKKNAAVTDFGTVC